MDATTNKPSSSRVHIRWMIRRDMDSVMAIENQAFGNPWTEDEFISCLRQRNTIGMVAEDDWDGPVVGFMVYELFKSHLQILSFAVRESHQRCGVGSRMMDKLVGKLSPYRRNRMAMEVREGNLAGQFFLRAMGFKAVKVLRDYYDTSPEDCYVFERTI